MELAALVIQEMNDFMPDATFCDAGHGAGVIDRVRQLGYDITEVPFGSTPMQPGRFTNKRSEMWYLIYEWILAGGQLPNVPELKTDLTVPTYGFDEANKIRLEKKESIKTRLGKSPDLADALALTFAFPVFPMPRTAGGIVLPGQQSFANNSYDPMNR